MKSIQDEVEYEAKVKMLVPLAWLDKEKHTGLYFGDESGISLTSVITLLPAVSGRSGRGSSAAQ